MLYNVVIGYQHFEGHCCLNIQGEVSGDGEKRVYRSEVKEGEMVL